jgi:hypothetical protein
VLAVRCGLREKLSNLSRNGSANVGLCDAVHNLPWRYLLSDGQYTLTVASKCSFVYCRKETMAFQALVLTKLMNALRYYVPVSRTVFRSNQIVNVEIHLCF